MDARQKAKLAIKEHRMYDFIASEGHLLTRDELWRICLEYVFESDNDTDDRVLENLEEMDW